MADDNSFKFGNSSSSAPSTTQPASVPTFSFTNPDSLLLHLPRRPHQPSLLARSSQLQGAVHLRIRAPAASSETPGSRSLMRPQLVDHFSADHYSVQKPAQPAAPSGGLFGSTTQQSQPSNSLFGSAAQNQQPPASLFGSSAQPQQPSLFGSTTQPAQPSLFGSTQQAPQPSLFSSTQQPGSSLFNSQPSQPQASLLQSQPGHSGLNKTTRFSDAPENVQNIIQQME